MNRSCWLLYNHSFFLCLSYTIFFSIELHFPTVHIPFHAPVFALQFPLWRCPSLPPTSCKVLSSFKSQVKGPFSSQPFAAMLSHFPHLHIIISCVSVCDSPTRLPLLCNRSYVVCMLSLNFIVQTPGIQQLLAHMPAPAHTTVWLELALLSDFSSMR